MTGIDFTPEEMRMCRRAINDYLPKDQHFVPPVFATISGAHALQPSREAAMGPDQ